MTDILKHLCQELEAAGIAYMLSGSMALNVYAVPRMTLDIDVILHLDQTSADRFLQAMESDYFVDDIGIRAEIKRKGMFNLIHKGTAIRVDCIVRQDSPYRLAEFERRQLLDIGGFEAYVTTLEDLILSKLIWVQELQSEKQFQDIRMLLDTGKADPAYLRYWVDRLRLQTFSLL